MYMIKLEYIYPNCIHIYIVSLLFYTIATVFQLYHADDMIYEMTRRKPKTKPLLTHEIFNLPHHTGITWEKLAFDAAAIYVAGKLIAAQQNVIAVNRIRSPVPRVNKPVLSPTELSPRPHIYIYICIYMYAIIHASGTT